MTVAWMVWHMGKCKTLQNKRQFPDAGKTFVPRACLVFTVLLPPLGNMLREVHPSQRKTLFSAVQPGTAIKSVAIWTLKSKPLGSAMSEKFHGAFSNQSLIFWCVFRAICVDGF